MKNHNCRPISRFLSEKTRTMAIVTIKDRHALSICTSFDDVKVRLDTFPTRVPSFQSL